MDQPRKVANPARDELKKIGVASSILLGCIRLKNNLNVSRPSEHPQSGGKVTKRYVASYAAKTKPLHGI